MVKPLKLTFVFMVVLYATFGFDTDSLAGTPQTITALSDQSFHQSTFWFSPDPQTVDIQNLFTQPQLWTTVQQSIGVFKLAPDALESGTSDFTKFVAANAFQQLSAMGVAIALEAPAVKPWDCSAMNGALTQTNQVINDVQVNGGSINYIAMDEPLFAGTNPTQCNLSFTETALRTASYINALRSNLQDQPPGALLQIGDVEPYPTMSVNQIIAFVDALTANGAKPVFMHIDTNIAYLDRNPSINWITDFMNLKQALQQRGILFGVIIWPGYGVISSDQSYYNHTMNWVNRLHDAAINPDQIIFQSWVQRGPSSCHDTHLNCQPCSDLDPYYCGLASVPFNLEGNYSHIRLIQDGIAALASLNVYPGNAFYGFYVPNPDLGWPRYRYCPIEQLGNAPITVLNQVAFTYCLVQTRTADPTGLQSYASAISNGKYTFQQFYDATFNSPEFNNRFQPNNMNNTDFVTFLYRLLLWRDPDAPGLASFINALNKSEITRQTVFDDIVQSAEFVSKHPIMTGAF